MWINSAEPILARELFSQMVDDLSPSRLREFLHAAAVIAVVWFKNIRLLGDIDRSCIVPSTILSQKGVIYRDLFLRERGRQDLHRFCLSVTEVGNLKKNQGDNYASRKCGNSY